MLPQPPEISNVYLLTELVKLATEQAHIAATVQRLDETNEGTLRTPGMKAKMAVAEQNIQKNQEAYLKLESSIETFKKELQGTVVMEFEKLERKLEAQTLELKGTTTYLQKIRPFVDAIVYIVALAAPIILGMILTGNLRLP